MKRLIGFGERICFAVMNMSALLVETARINHIKLTWKDKTQD